MANSNVVPEDNLIIVEKMETDDVQKDTKANQMLLEVYENTLSDKTEVVKSLLISNNELFSQKCLDESLLSCCRKGIILMPAIISAGANIEVTDENGNTPLLVSALYKNENCMRYLLEAGVKVNGVNSDGNTPLIASIMNCVSTDIIKTLVGSKDTNIDHVNNKGYTALLYAIETTNFNAIKLLIDAGASSKVTKTCNENVFKNMASKKLVLSLINLLKLKTVKGKSPLLRAVLNRDLESAKIMISMDKSILKTPKDPFQKIMIPFLKSIQDNNIIVNQPELDMFDFLLTQVTAISQKYSEKEMIMDILISIGDCELVERLLKFDYIISYTNLSSAVSNPEFLCYLLTKKHVINKLNRQNKPVYVGSPLHNAMMGVEIESAKALIEHGAFMDIDQALEDAVEWNQEKAIQFIVSEFPNQIGQKLTIPKLLCNAAINSALNIIQFLLDNGADINAKYMTTCCLTQAVDVNVLELLLSRGADPNIKIGTSRYCYPIHTFFSTKFENMLWNKFRTLRNRGRLNTFWNSETIDFIECLLRHGAQVDLKDYKGRTALNIAATRYDYVPIVQFLIDSGADVNEMDNNGEGPIRNAVKIQNVEMVRCLINSGAIINLANKTTSKPIIFEAKNDTILNILLDNGVDVKSTNGDCPLISLLADHHIGMDNVKRLIDAGCDVNYVNKDGETVLIHAAKHVDIKLLELLVQEGADVNASGRTFSNLNPVTFILPKLWDDSNRATSCINYLLDNGVNIDNVPSGAIHILISCKCVSLIPIFLSRGLAPTHLSIKRFYNNWFEIKTPTSPLMMALLLNQSDLAQYFFNTKYLMNSDIAVLYGNRHSRILIKHEQALDSLKFLKNVCQGPLSLETLCLVVVSDTLGATQESRSKVLKLEIPQTLQNSLLFKNAKERDIEDVGYEDHYFFKQSLDQLHL